ncbi:MAG: ribokinase [Pseudomonadota bacterium]
MGSLCVDHVYAVPQISAAGETVASGGYALFPGGKGLNQSLAAAYAGASVVHFGAVGDDGATLLEVLQQAGVDTRGIERQSGPSGHAVIQVDAAGQNAIVIHGGANRSLPPACHEAALAALEAGDWLLLQNETNGVATCIADAPAHARTALNLAPPDARMHEYPIDRLDLLIVNEAEANALAGTQTADAAFVRLVSEFPALDLVLTLGAQGLWFHEAGAGSGQMSSHSVQAVDETAAGDAFVGYLLAALVAGQGLRHALQTASAAGALAVTTAGAATSIPAASDVRKLAEAQPLSVWALPA